MECCILPYLFIFLATFFKDVFLYQGIFVFVSILLFLVSLWHERGTKFFILFTLLFIQFTSSLPLSVVDSAIDEREISGIYCKVLSEPSAKMSRKKSFKVRLLASRDKNGSIFSISGVIYISSVDTDIHSGDTVYLDGRFSSNLFYSSGMRVIKSSFLSKLRHRMVPKIRSRVRGGEGGELSQLLLLGTGEKGEEEMTKLATESGLRHVLALSGLHLVVIALILRPIKSKIIVDGLLFVFIALSGFRPSLLRAYIFRLLMPLGTDIAFPLSLSILLFVTPYNSFDLGAIYSFAALSGIILLSERIEDTICIIIPKGGISSSISASIAALISSVPFSYFIFGTYNLASIIFSFPVGFLISIYLLLSLATVFLPSLHFFIDILYKALERLFLLASSFPMQSNLKGYIVFTFSVSIWCMISLVVSKHKIKLPRKLKRTYIAI